MKRPTITVVGLGPAGPELVTQRARNLLDNARVARLRTNRHPAAALFGSVPSFDNLYDAAESFDELYEQIVQELIDLAITSEDGHVIYAVPGSPNVAERTTQLLRDRLEIELIIEPAVSVIDVACAALRKDPMASSLRVVDALEGDGILRGPGPLLVLQTYSPEILAILSGRVHPDTEVVVLYHLGLVDQEIVRMTASGLTSFSRADHLTSVWIETIQTAGAAVDELVDLTKTLRALCPWDQEQTHQSLVRHLLEESYETIDAIEKYVAGPSEDSSKDVVEELGDLLFQIVIHAELGDEDDRFDLTRIVQTLHDKLVTRHPHVFGEVTAPTADDVAARWEDNKLSEKGRLSVTEGIPMDLPALVLYAKLRRKATSIGIEFDEGELLRGRLLMVLSSMQISGQMVTDATIESDRDAQWGDLIAVLSDLARWNGVDLEGVLRQRALLLRDEILSLEKQKSS